MYTAILLDENSHEKLKKFLRERYKTEFSNWKIFAHHMTIKMGPMPEVFMDDIGKKKSLEVHSIGKNETAIAVGVTGYWSKNQKPHVTLAVNVMKGGKPVDSNKIEKWQPLQTPFKISGIVTELG